MQDQPFNPWRGMHDAPKDRPILVHADDTGGYEPIGPLVSPCQWHPDAGFCVDELRIPILWRELQFNDFPGPQ